jgi:hypothetical protein
LCCDAVNAVPGGHDWNDDSSEPLLPEAAGRRVIEIIERHEYARFRLERQLLGQTLFTQRSAIEVVF